MNLFTLITAVNNPVYAKELVSYRQKQICKIMLVLQLGLNLKLKPAKVRTRAYPKLICHSAPSSTSSWISLPPIPVKAVPGGGSKKSGKGSPGSLLSLPRSLNIIPDYQLLFTSYNFNFDVNF